MAGAKRGGRRGGGEKSTKEGKGKGAPALIAGVPSPLSSTPLPFSLSPTRFDACYAGYEEVACVASVSVRFRSKERGTRVKDRAKNVASKRAGRGWGRNIEPIRRCVRWRTQVFKIDGVCLQAFPFFPFPPSSFIFWLSFHFSRGQN